jgi:hypothetical protein
MVSKRIKSWKKVEEEEERGEKKHCVLQQRRQSHGGRTVPSRLP